MGDIGLEKVSEFVWQIKKSGKMNVPGTIYASDKLIGAMKQDNTLQQLKNMATLKGIQTHAVALSDAHSGYGFCIGGVAAFDMNEGIISPGGVGYDINCGVRMMRTNLAFEDFKAKKSNALNEIFKLVPAGVGKGGFTRVSKQELLEVLQKGAKWAVDSGYGRKEDLQKMEEYGFMKNADCSKVSDRALKRGFPQLGTLGAGNHFVEIQKVEKIYDEKTAAAFGLQKEGQITIMIHTGSRGLGHQVASDYIKLMEDKFGFEGLADRELVNAPINSDLGQDYAKALSAGVNFAFANRQIIMHKVREAFRNVFGSDEGLDLIYDVCHNIAKFEKHKIEGKMKEVCVHRKGATRSFGPGRDEVPEIYRSIGQPVIIPGSMGTASYLLAGTKKAEEISFGSTAHGAGRLLSRHEALRRNTGEEVVRQLAAKGIEVKGVSWAGIAEEMPEAYKDVDEVVRVSNELGIGKLVAKVVPLEVMKG